MGQSGSVVGIVGTVAPESGEHALATLNEQLER